MTPVVYISGTGRSGTNLMKEILGSHSQVATLPFEHRYTIDPHGLVDYYKNIDNWSPYLAESKLRSLATFLRNLASRDTKIFDESQQLRSEGKTGHPYAGWELDKWIPKYSIFVEELLTQLTDFEYQAAYPGTEAGEQESKMYYPNRSAEVVKMAIGNFIEQCNAAITSQQDKSIFVEDNTWSILFADVLSKLTPEGKMVHMIRDPRDVIASMQRQDWTPTSLENIVKYYKDLISQWQIVRKQLPASFYLEIKLEDLLSETKYTLNDICEFIGVKVEQSMLEVDLSKGNLGKYKKQFDSAEIEFIESELSDIFDQYQYP